MYSRVFDVLDERDRVLFFLVKSARGGPLETLGSQFTANALARHEDGEYLWAIRATTQARVTMEWISRTAGLRREIVRAAMSNDQKADDAFALAYVALPGGQKLPFGRAANGEAFTPVFNSEDALRKWLAASAATLTVPGLPEARFR